MPAMNHMPKATRTALAVVAAWAIVSAGASPPTPLPSPGPLVPSAPSRAIVDGHPVQPRVGYFSQHGQADISSADAAILDRLYRKQIQESGSAEPIRRLGRAR